MRYSIILALILFFIVGCASNLPFEHGEIKHLHDYQWYSPQGKKLHLDSLPEEIVSADVVFVGEYHKHAGIHRFQADLLSALQRERPVTLSMEQFSRDVQHVVQAYLDGEIGEQPLIENGNAWPNYESDYRPLLEFARKMGMDVIAANAPKAMVRCVGRHGLEYLDRLSPAERALVAESIDISTSPYKTKFMASMHHGAPERNERMFAAQMSWDETMADSIARYIWSHPGTQIMHIAGKFHTEEGYGTVASLLRRLPKLKVVIITPVFTLDNLGSDYQLKVMPLPERFVQDANRFKSFHSLKSRNDELVCL